VMFISLALARGDEHSSSSYRRLLYGYNTVLTGCLLLLILIIANVIVYIPWGPLAFFNNTFYWSDASIYALSSQSEHILQGLDKPLKVYVIVPEHDPFNHPIHALLDNCRSVRPEIQVKYLSPDLNKPEVTELATEYKFGAERKGILLVYGSAPKAENRFVKYDDLVSHDTSEMASRSSQGFFKGEAALMGEVNSLAEGKEKPVVYFTQGNGELDINDRQVTNRADEGCGVYRDRLEDSINVKVKGLQFSPVEGATGKNPDVVVSKKVPDDAAVVVIAGPRKRFDKYAVEALRDYLQPADPKKKKGKLFALFDVVVNDQGQMEPTGLESLLAEFNVEVGNNRVLEAQSRIVDDPEVVLAVVNPAEDVRLRNPVADAFLQKAFLLLKPRTVSALQAGGRPPQMERYRTDALLLASPEEYPWVETNLQADARAVVKKFEDDPAEFRKKVRPELLSLAVAVSETTPSMGGDPHAFMNSEDKPRLVVVGSAQPLRNSQANSNYFRGFYSFFASDVAWLRERPSNIGIEAKKRDFYIVKPDTNFSRMMWLPAILMFVGVVGLGTGVWVVRRR
jgi:hypothetical protein